MDIDGMTGAGTEDFNLDRYLRASKRVDLTGVGWDRVKDHSVRPEEARTLAYIWTSSRTR